MNKYSIIIPVYNEIYSINALLKSLKCYFKKGHEIILIDDGSTDGSKNILTKNKIIKLISIKNNKGKGYAIKEGLKIARNNKIIIYTSKAISKGYDSLTVIYFKIINIFK